ncbi:flagellar hook-associated protein FlgK [Clostridium sp. Marseille-P299]|uniref:flagellar hook-associated protein FlgK n=1 Tax=Clostridium sp. Marseille-P299 TaxID=1805477 RepID=UPI0008328D11|nr:flagellar hook-associated protein FlgK [Clostridium sp. Marseille-P299]
MPSTFFGLSIGRTGLYASQAGLTTTAHNIANTETEGYTRQVVNQQANKALRVNSSYGMAGTGVGVTGIVQARDEYYDMKYRTNSTISGTYSTKAYYMTEIENYFNEIKLEGFTTTYDKMYDSIQELSKNPSDISVRTQVTNLSQGLCDYFNSLSTSLKSIQENCNTELYTQVGRVNSLAQQISVLSKQINTFEVGGGTANDLRDQRELLVDELSNYAEVSVSETVVGNGVGVNSYVVKINQQVLVDNYSANSLVCVPREEKINQSDVDGLYDIQWANGQTFNTGITGTSGNLQAIIDIRDGNNNEAFTGKVTAETGDLTISVTASNINDVEKMTMSSSGVITIGSREYAYDGFAVSLDEDTGEYVYEFSLKDAIVTSVDDANVRIGKNIDYKGIPYYMSQMNQFVRTYAKAFNEISKSGQDLYGNTGLDFFNAVDPVTGENYVFETSETDKQDGYLFTTKTGNYMVDGEDANYGSYYFMTIDNIGVTKDIIKDPNKLVTATDITNGVESADLVSKYLELKDDTTLFRQGTATQYLNALIGELGIDSAKATNFATNQENILKSVQNQRLSVSGVDSEEEAMNLIRYKSAYEFSSKIISTLNEIYNKLINETGV